MLALLDHSCNEASFYVVGDLSSPLVHMRTYESYRRILLLPKTV